MRFEQLDRRHGWTWQASLLSQIPSSLACINEAKETGNGIRLKIIDYFGML